MFKKLFSLLGYVKQSELDTLKAEADEMSEKIISLERRMKDLLKSNKNWKESAQQAQKELNKKNQEIEDLNLLVDTVKNELELVKADNIKLNKSFKKEQKKVHRLLEKRYVLRNAFLKKEKECAYLSIYNNLLTTRLEYLCFGSIMPKILVPSGIHRYQHLFKPVNINYFIDKYGQLRTEAQYSFD